MSYGTFIDWLTITQRYPFPVPTIGKRQLHSTDIETGEFTDGRLIGVNYEGSYSSNLLVTASGNTISISGNPSRIGRPDNLFGFKTFKECINKYNTITRAMGLPDFTPNKNIDDYQASNPENIALMGDGAEIRGADFTKNYAVGYGNEKDFLRAISTATIYQKVPELKPNGQTIIFHNGSSYEKGGQGSRHVYHKIYNKSHDLKLFKSSKRFKTLTDEGKQYIERLIRYCEGKGIIREEKGFKPKWIQKHGLQFYGRITEQPYTEQLGEVEEIMNTLSVSSNDYNNVATELLEKGICKTQLAANTTEIYFNNWTLGRPQPRNSQWYVHRKRLKALGIDIAMTLDLTRKMPDIRSGKVINLENVEPPSWYKLPGETNLQLIK